MRSWTGQWPNVAGQVSRCRPLQRDSASCRKSALQPSWSRPTAVGRAAGGAGRAEPAARANSAIWLTTARGQREPPVIPATNSQRRATRETPDDTAKKTRRRLATEPISAFERIHARKESANGSSLPSQRPFFWASTGPASPVLHCWSSRLAAPLDSQTGPRSWWLERARQRLLNTLDGGGDRH